MAVYAVLLPAGLAAQDDQIPDGWAFKGELTSVWSAGNEKSFTFGLGTKLTNKWGRNLFRLEAGGIRTEYTIITRRAVGTADLFDIVVDEDRQRTAEAYFVRSRYDRQLNDRFYVLGGLDWMRNTFAGVDSRFVLVAGAGTTWFDNARARFKTDYALTYTFEKDVIRNSLVDENFPGLRAGWEYWLKATESTEFESLVVTDLNLSETDDVAIDFTNSLIVSINSKLALKPSLQLLWRNQPALAAVDLFAPSGTPRDVVVTTPLEKLDTFFKLALVVTI
jgi:hypothetical protein